LLVFSLTSEYINIALLAMRTEFYIVFLCCITGMIYRKTIVKIGDIDVVLMMVLSSELMDQEIALHSK